MRRLLTCAALAGKNILSKNTRGDTPEWAKDLGYHVTICHRNKLNRKVIPRVAEELDSGAKNLVEAFARMYMCSGASDGWTDMVDDPILNFLQITPLGIRLVNAINASGKTKDKQYICDISIQSMDASGGCEVYILLWTRTIAVRLARSRTKAIICRCGAFMLLMMTTTGASSATRTLISR